MPPPSADQLAVTLRSWSAGSKKIALELPCSMVKSEDIWTDLEQPARLRREHSPRHKNVRIMVGFLTRKDFRALRIEYALPWHGGNLFSPQHSPRPGTPGRGVVGEGFELGEDLKRLPRLGPLTPTPL